MAKLNPDTVVLRDRKLKLKRRSGSTDGVWQIHFKLPNSKIWYRKTSGTSDLKEATEIAEDTYADARALSKRGLPVVSKKFKAVANQVVTKLQAKIDAGTGKPAEKDSISAINKWLNDFFGEYNVDSITPALISKFHDYRTEKVGYELKASTQANHNAALNRVFDEAIELGYMTSNQRPSLKNTGDASERRPTFTHDELVELMKKMPAWIKEGHTERTRWIRQLMSIYVPFVAQTGLRPGTETEFLEWRHLGTRNLNGETYLTINVLRGKVNKHREVIAHASCWSLIESLKDTQPDIAQMKIEAVLKAGLGKRLFSLPDGTQPDNFNVPFKNLMEYAGLLTCKITNKDRSLYSLRHYYATEKLLQGMHTSILAHQMGTSPKMLDMHYDHLTSLMKPEQFAQTPTGGNDLEEQIKSLTAVSTANANFMQLAEMGSGISIALRYQNPSEFERLEDALKSSQPNPQ